MRNNDIILESDEKDDEYSEIVSASKCYRKSPKSNNLLFESINAKNEERIKKWKLKSANENYKMH